jgi:hypothetical protein
MNIRIELASNIDLDDDFDLDNINVSEPTSGYVLFSNRRDAKYKYQSKITQIKVLIGFPQVFREWLWKMHNHKSLPSSRELKRMDDQCENPEFVAEVYYYNDIVSCAASFAFAKCESPVIVVNDMSDKVIAEVLARYINYVNSLPN